MFESVCLRNELQQSTGQGPGMLALRQAARRPVQRWRGPLAVPAQLHDTLFRVLTESPQRADRLVRDALPTAFAELLADAPRPPAAPGSFVDSGLRTVQADRLLEFTPARRAVGGGLRPARAQEFRRPRHAAATARLHGQDLAAAPQPVAGWPAAAAAHHPAGVPPRPGRGGTVPPSVLAMIDAPGPLLKFARSLEYVLLDLGGIPFLRLASDPVLRAGLGLLKFASRGPVPAEAAVQIRDVLVRLRAEDALLDACLKYIDVVMPDEAAGESPEDGPGTKENLMATMAQRWQQEGKAEVLLRQLMLRFGAVPDAVKARVRAAVGADLDAWLDAILEAPRPRVGLRQSLHELSGSGRARRVPGRVGVVRHNGPGWPCGDRARLDSGSAAARAWWCFSGKFRWDGPVRTPDRMATVTDPATDQRDHPLDSRLPNRRCPVRTSRLSRTRRPNGSPRNPRHDVPLKPGPTHSAKTACAGSRLEVQLNRLGP